MKFGDTLYLETVRLAEGIKKPSLRLDIQKALLAAHERVEELQDRLGLKLEPICHHEIHDVLHDAEICAKELANAKLHAENLEKQNAELKEMYKKADAAATYYRESCECQQKTIDEVIPELRVNLDSKTAALDLATDALIRARSWARPEFIDPIEIAIDDPAISSRMKEIEAMEKCIEAVKAIYPHVHLGELACDWGPTTSANLFNSLRELNAVRGE